MEIIYGKQLSDNEQFICQQIAVECGILMDTARLLLYRGVDTVEKAKAFLSPSKKRFNNPFHLDGMKEAVSRIEKAKNNRENVLVFGDYDADGICATAILYNCLKDFGLDARTVIPEREEGYGLNVEKIAKLNSELKIDLIITVDCGISDAEKIAQIEQMGIDVIVTDHHEPPKERLSCIAINPKLPMQKYPFNGLCGAGVAYKLGYAIIGEKADDYLDFVALATIADSMDLIGENRDIVVEGLKLFNKKDLRPQFEALLSENNGRSVSAQTLAYTIAPRINAGGRMGDANLALKLFLSQNRLEIFDLTAKLVEYNIARQVECDKIYKEAKEIIRRENFEKDEIILIAGDGWRAGFIGIVAAKLVEDYSRPVIVFAEQDGFLKGSARSVEQVNIYDAISSVKDLLMGFGGHSQAAGISVEKDNLPKIREALNKFIKNNYGKLDFEKKVYAEWNVQDEFSLRFANEIDMLEPFGVGNKRPFFTTEVSEVQSRPLKLGSIHYSYRTEVIEMLDFNGGNNVFTLSLPINKKVLFEVNLSTYKNKQSLKGYSRLVLAEYGDYSKIKPCIFANQLENLKSDIEQKYLIVSKKNIDKYKTIGTIFAVDDVDNLQFYPELKDLNVYLFNAENKNSSACVVVSPNNMTAGYDKVVYLDKPMANAFFTKNSYLIEEKIGYKILDNVSLDRQIFTDCFIKLKSLVGKDFTNIWQFCSRFCGEDDIYQFIFCTTVFLELGIFGQKNGKFIFDSNVKNPLTNSKVYSKISLIKN